MKKFLYFRNVTAVADDDNTEDSACFPASALIGMVPSGDSTLKLIFNPALRPLVDASGAADTTGNLPNADTVILNLTTANTHRRVMQSITGAMNSAGAINDPFIIIADDATDDNNAASVYLTGDISSCGTITHNGAFTNA